MGLPRVDVITCVLIATAILGAWVRLKLPMGWPHHEASLRRQNMRAYWAFGLLICLELLAQNFFDLWSRLMMGFACALIYYFFAMVSYQATQGFWSKRRNKILSLAPLLLIGSTLSLILKELSFLPLFTAFAISQICHKKYVQIVYSSIQDLETLQAKILKLEATHANMRYFNQLSSRPSSRQA